MLYRSFYCVLHDLRAEPALLYARFRVVELERLLCWRRSHYSPVATGQVGVVSDYDLLALDTISGQLFLLIFFFFCGNFHFGVRYWCTMSTFAIYHPKIVSGKKTAGSHSSGLLGAIKYFCICAQSTHFRIIVHDFSLRLTVLGEVLSDPGKPTEEAGMFPQAGSTWKVQTLKPRTSNLKPQTSNLWHSL